MTTTPVTVQERLPIPPGMARRPSAAGPPSGMTFSDVVRILKQRAFLIIFMWLFVTGATAGGYVYWLKFHQQFVARGLIRVESQNASKPMELGNPTVAVDMLNRLLMDEAEALKGDDVLDQAFRDDKLRSTAWYQKGVNEKDWFGGLEGSARLYKKLKDDLEVIVIPNTSYIQVSFPAGTKDDAEIIAQTVMDKYRGVQQQVSNTNLNQKLTNAQKDLKDLSDMLEAKRRDRAALIANIDAPGVVRGIQVDAERWRTFSMETERLDVEQYQLKANWENLRDQNPSQLALSPSLKMNVQQDPQVMALNNMLMNLEQDYNSSLGRLGPRHRMIQTLSAQITAAQKQHDDLVSKKEGEIQKFQQMSAETAYLNALQSCQALEEQASEFKAKQKDLDDKLLKVGNLEEEQEMLKKQHEGLSDYVQNLKMLVNSQETRNVIKVGQAKAPPQRSSPRWEYWMPVGSILGLALGLGMALLLEVASTSICTPRDLVRHVHIPILGTVPDLDDEEVDIDRIELASHTAPRSMIAEAFRNIRTNLLLSSPAERQRTVLFTSARPEEGKTSVAVNLAIAIGQSGRRVLLVDANFHRPALHTIFPKAHREGLSNILIGRGRLEDLVSPTELPNLDVLTCGPIPPNPTELLSSRYLPELLAQAAGRYDQILLDGPPALLVSDALVLASAVDGVILVCRAKCTSRGTIQRAREQIERVNARIFGAVLNAAQVARGGYFREQMRSYYDYQPEEALAGAGATRALPAEPPENPPPA